PVFVQYIVATKWQIYCIARWAYGSHLANNHLNYFMRFEMVSTWEILDNDSPPFIGTNERTLEDREVPPLEFNQWATVILLNPTE
ncbi:hypothetical protein FRC10_004486, partial [Ceratobasidium sp. 414]